MNTRTKMTAGALVALAVGVGVMFAGLGPLAYPETFALSAVALMMGGTLVAFGFGLAASGGSLRRAMWIGALGSLVILGIVACRVMSNENRAMRVLSAFGIELSHGERGLQ